MNIACLDVHISILSFEVQSIFPVVKKFSHTGYEKIALDFKKKRLTRHLLPRSQSISKIYSYFNHPSQNVYLLLNYYDV